MKSHINIRHKHSARRPYGLAACRLPPEADELTQRQAVEVFTAMVNSGKSFQQALQAVYLSGMAAAQEVMKP